MIDWLGAVSILLVIVSIKQTPTPRKRHPSDNMRQKCMFVGANVGTLNLSCSKNAKAWSQGSPSTIKWAFGAGNMLRATYQHAWTKSIVISDSQLNMCIDFLLKLNKSYKSLSIREIAELRNCTFTATGKALTLKLQAVVCLIIKLQRCKRTTWMPQYDLRSSVIIVV